jgi:hypothetical protein
MAKQNIFQRARNYLVPTMGGPGVDGNKPPINVNVPAETPGDVTKNLRKYVSPVQLARIVTDVAFLNAAINLAENAWYPQRVKLQQLFLTTIRNGHVSACMDRRMNLTKLKDYRMVDAEGNENKEATKVIKSKWFRDLLRYALEAKPFGYSLITLGNLVADKFPDLSIIRRFNISPDRLNVTQFVYSISGAQFMEEPYKDWHIWVPTPTDVGISPCGYGYLYKVALYEIFCRNTLSQNSTAAELFGMPIRKGKTAKTDEVERATYEQALANMGSAGYILMDLTDELDLVESKGLGQGYKIYESLETRCEKKISKIILGHADALDSTAGKLGGEQGGEESPAAQAMRDTATNDMADIVDLCNDTVFPKLINLGMTIFEGLTFEFGNNDELADQRNKEDDANQKTATIFQAIKQAGGDPDWKYFTDRTGIPVEATPPPPPPPMFHAGLPGVKPEAKPGSGKELDDKVKNKLEKLYGK